MRRRDLRSGSAPSTGPDAHAQDASVTRQLRAPSMRRRHFLQLASSAAAAWPLGALSQQSSYPPLVAVLTPGNADWAQERLVALRKGLQEAGLTEGVHYTIALRFAEGQIDRLPTLVKELEAMKPAVFFTGGTFLAVRQELRPDIPVVFASIAADPIEYGLAQSYAKPGGRFTGQVLNALGGEESVTEKRIAHFKELVPTVGKLGLIGPRTGTVRLFDHEVSAARGVAERLGVEARPYSIQTIDDLEEAVASALRDGVDAFYVSGEPIMITNLRRVVPLLASSGKPTLGTYVDWARAGLLMAYAADISDSVTVVAASTSPRFSRALRPQTFRLNRQANSLSL
jgi:putative tryptophan/tyrosine transport system substrate-binding protein